MALCIEDKYKLPRCQVEGLSLTRGRVTFHLLFIARIVEQKGTFLQISDWQSYIECATFTHLTFDPYLTAMCLDHLLNNSQPQA